MLVHTRQAEVAQWPPYCIFTLGRKTEAGRWDDTKRCEGRLDTHNRGLGCSKGVCSEGVYMQNLGINPQITLRGS